MTLKGGNVDYGTLRQFKMKQMFEELEERFPDTALIRS